LNFLKKLELGMNRIQRIEGIAKLANLMQLSLEDNAITSLEGNKVYLMNLQ
jgi:Leucine-rich repeat (LRR) protein